MDNLTQDEAAGLYQSAIGHNSGSAPADIATLLDPDVLRDQLGLDHADILSRRDNLLAGAVRFHETCPVRPQTDEESGKAQDFAVQIKKCIKAAKDAHEPAKRPFLEAGRVVDAVLKAETQDPLAAAVKRIEDKITLFLRHKAAEERRIADEEAARLAREAEQLAAQAESTANVQVADTLIDRAVETSERADVAAKVAMSSNTDLSRTRGAYGSVASLRDNWVWSVKQPDGLLELIKAAAEGRVPANYLMINESMINSLVKNKQGVRDIPGLDIRNEPKAGVR